MDRPNLWSAYQWGRPMTDPIDHAQELEERQRDTALRRQATRAGLAGKTMADSAKGCQDCDQPIPEARRWAVPGCQRCVKCQTIYEEK